MSPKCVIPIENLELAGGFRFSPLIHRLISDALRVITASPLNLIDHGHDLPVVKALEMDGAAAA